MRSLVGITLLAAVACAPGSLGCARNTDPCGRTAPPAPIAEPTREGLRNSDGSPRDLPPPRPGIAGKTQVLEYADFGPPVAAGELLGDEAYDWPRPCSEAGGCGSCFAIDDRFDVHIVVFQGDRHEVEAQYPTIPGLSDYRLITRDAALSYLDREIASLRDLTEEDRVLCTLRDRLELTRTRIAEALPGSP